MIYDILCPVCGLKVGESEIADLMLYHEEHKPVPVVDPLDAERVQCKERIEFGKQIILDFLAKNSMLNLSIPQTVSCLTKLMNVKILLEVGALESARASLLAVVPDDVITSERLEGAAAKISAFLGL